MQQIPPSEPGYGAAETAVRLRQRLMLNSILIIFMQLNYPALDKQPFYCEVMLNAQNDQGEQIPQNNSLYLKDLISAISKRFSLFFHLFLMSLCLPNPPT